MFWNEPTGIPELAGSWLAGSETFGKILKWSSITVVVVAMLLMNRTFTWDSLTNTVATTAMAAGCFAIIFGAFFVLTLPLHLLVDHTRWRWPRVVVQVLWAQLVLSIAWSLIWHHTPTPDGAGDLATHVAQAFIVSALIGWTFAVVAIVVWALFRATGKVADRLTAGQAAGDTPAAQQQNPPTAAWPAPRPFQRIENLPTLNWQPPDQHPPAGQ